MARRLSPTKREALWRREARNAALDGRGRFPICNLCDQPVAPQDAWDESHFPVARAFGCDAVVPLRTGVAHERCNRVHGAKVVTPALAKSDRVRQFHIGARGPGLGKAPLPGGRRSGRSKTFRNGVQPRLTLTEKLARMRAARAVAPLDQPEA